MTSLRESFSRLPRPVWVLVGGTFVNRFGGFALIFLVLYVARKGYSPAAAGAAVSAYGLGSVSSALLGGHMADRLGRRNTIVVSLVSSAASMLLLSQANRLPAILAFSALAGMTTELYRPAASALIADLVPEEDRLAGFAAYRFAINLGVTAGPAVGGLVAERSFFALFAVDAATSLAFAVAALVGLPHGTHERQPEERPGDMLRTLRGDRTFRIFLLASLLGAIVYMQHASTLPLQVVADGHSTAFYGALLSINGIVIVILEIPLLSVVRRVPRVSGIALGQALQGAGFFLIAFSGSSLWLAFTAVVWTTGEMIYSPLANTYVAGLAPDHMRGRYLAAWGLTWSVATVAAPVLGTAVFAKSHAAVWLACLGLGLTSGALILGSSFSNKSGPRRAAAGP